MRGFTTCWVAGLTVAGSSAAWALEVTTPSAVVSFVEGTSTVEVPLFASGGETFNVLSFAAVLGDGGPPVGGVTDTSDPTFSTDSIQIDGSLFEAPTVDLPSNGLTFVLALDSSVPLPGEVIAAQLAVDVAGGGSASTVDGVFAADGLLLTLEIDVSNMTAGQEATLVTGGILDVPGVPDIPNTFSGGDAGAGLRPTFPTVVLSTTPIPEPTLLSGVCLAGLLLRRRR